MAIETFPTVEVRCIDECNAKYLLTDYLFEQDP